MDGRWTGADGQLPVDKALVSESRWVREPFWQVATGKIRTSLGKEEAVRSRVS